MRKKIFGTILSLTIMLAFTFTVPTDAYAESKVVHSGADEDADIAEEIEWKCELDDSEIYYADDLDYSIRFASFELVQDPHNYHIYYPQLVYKNKKNASKVNEIIKDRACTVMDKMYPKFQYDEDYNKGRNESTVTYEISYMDNDYISIVFYNDYFLGSNFAEYHDCVSCTIDLKKQERMRIYDFFEPAEDLSMIVFNNIVSNSTTLESAPEFKRSITDTLIKEGVADNRYNLGVVFLNGKIGMPFSYHYGDGNLIARGALLLRIEYDECAPFMINIDTLPKKVQQDIEFSLKVAEESQKKESLIDKKKKPYGFRF